MNDPRFLQEEGQGIFTGNELLVKGGLESRLGLLTGYPGSPVAEVFDAAGRVADLLIERGVLVQIANNEALAAARLNGSQMAPVRAMAVMKSVGAHVASDGLAIGNMAGTGPSGGVVAVFGDDTWSEGTQVPADSRFIAKHLYMPLLEPSTFQEVKDWIGSAFELSESTGLYVAYLVTSNQADGGGTVRLRPNRYPALSINSPIEIDSQAIPSEDRVVIPPLTSMKEDEVLNQRLPAFLEAVRARGLNQILHAPTDGRRRIGFVTSSLATCYLEHALDMVGLAGSFPILKYGVTYPLETEILGSFSDRVDEIYVVEEKRGFLEEQVTAAMQDLHQAGRVGPFRVWGKRFPDGWQGFPVSRGLNPSIVLKTLAPVLLSQDEEGVSVDRDRIRRELELIDATEGFGVRPTVRTPSFCPGCPHRDSASVLNRIVDDFGDEDTMRKRHSHRPVDLVFHGDIGCYTLLKHKPFNRLMHNLSGMGLGGGTGAGIDRFITNKQVVFMGDSTFFHSGMAAISDSIKHGQDITYVILDNKTTAMTGHQPTPGSDVDVMGLPTFAQDIERTVRGMAGSDGDTPVHVMRMDPEAREAYREALEAAILRDGVKVIVAEKECGITYHRRAKARQREEVRERGYQAEEVHINITPEACEYCLECTRATGCSGLTVEEGLHGPKIATDLSLCVADGACTRVRVSADDKTCPCFEELTVRRRQPAEARTEAVDLTGLVEPTPDDFDGTWYAYIAGVGGMGINTISAILSVAGAKQGYAVRFTNKKGLAIRNGAVYSHVGFAKDDRVLSPLTPYGHANLLLGLDILEAVRGLDSGGTGRVSSPEHTTAVVETGKRHTILTLTGEDDFDPVDLEAVLKKHTRADRYFGMDLGEISERFLGNKIYANSVLLGVAYQRGALPLALDNIRWAMKQNIRRADLEPNLKAFDLGRKIALKPEVAGASPETITWSQLLSDKASILLRTRGRKASAACREIASAIEATDLGEEGRTQFVLGVYDLIQWGGPQYARSYADRVMHVYQMDRADQGYRATEAVIRCLARAMAYKDEIYVAALLTSEEKSRRDHERYDVDPSRGDTVRYRHLTRPHFVVLGVDIQFGLRARPWMLSVLRRMRFLRKLFPSWHAEEKRFRDWYVGLVDGFANTSDDVYQDYVKALMLPGEVRGYRQVVWPKMEAAYREAAALLHRAGPPSTGEPRRAVGSPAEPVGP